MSDKKEKRSKRRKDEYTGPGGAEQEADKPAKDEFNVAKWLRKNVPTKRTKFLNHNVEYFSAGKALDALMASKFAQGDNCLFPSRESAIDLLDVMLVHKFYHRAKKVPVTEAELKRGKKSDKEAKEKELPAVKEKKESSKDKHTKEDKATDAESSHVEGKAERVTEKEKRKRKIRLDMHPDQVFVDGPEAYVWIYDPIPVHYWLFGALLVIGAIVVCLFPLWPPALRKGVYYLSIAAAGFLVFILGLAVIRFLVFCAVWILSGSKHHFWLFPNLTEDVGFFASFWPLYQHEYKDGTESGKDKKNKKRKKDKDSDAEEDPNAPLLEDEHIDDVKEDEKKPIETKSASYEPVKTKTPEHKPVPALPIEKIAPVIETDRKNSTTPSESDSESSQRSSTGKDFEMVNPDDVETS